jgi:hypothetical protein
LLLLICLLLYFLKKDNGWKQGGCIGTNQAIEMKEFKEKWKPIKFLASKELRRKIRRDAKESGLNISDYLRKLTEEK